MLCAYDVDNFNVKGMRTVKVILAFVISTVFTIWAFAAEIVSHAVESPATQANEVNPVYSPNKYDNGREKFNHAETQATGTGYSHGELVGLARHSNG